MPSVEEALAQAWQSHQAGQLLEAEQRYRQILEIAPSNHTVWYLLGSACHVLGSLDEALASYHEALRLQPHFAEAYSNLGALYSSQARWDETVACCRRALELQPACIDSRINLGAALTNLGKPEDAIPHLQHALVLDAANPHAHNNLGVALRRQGRTEAAAAYFQEAVRLKPDFASAHYNLGNAHHQQGRLADAAASYRRALELHPDYAQARNNLGVVLNRQGRPDEAAECLQQALALRPADAEAYNNLGIIYADQGRLDEALACFRQALTSRPDYSTAHSNLLTCWNYDPTVGADFLCAEHGRWADVQARVYPAAGHANDRNPERRLRVGYVSPDFRRHVVADFLEPIFAHHDVSQVEVFAYAEVSAPDSVTARFKARAQGWRPTLGLSDEQVVNQVRADGIDILVDLAGHTSESRLRVFAYKPAPVQITYLGYPNTTGLTVIDYRFTDAILDPPGEPARHVEELIRLPHAFCYQPQQSAPAVSPLPARTSGRISFGSFHNLAKLNGQVLNLWCDLLRAVPSAHLVVFQHTLRGSAAAYFYDQLMRRGIGPDRFALSLPDDRSTHLLAYRSVDIALDAFPWNGHATTCEALWMGVPVITLLGSRYAGRLAATTLTAVGLTDFIAVTPEVYVSIAREWATDLDRLSRLRSALRQRMQSSPLCDGAAFTRNLEQAYRTLWRRWCAQSNPDAK
jgi:predicted O-linked N-acetylglucosamine transferase (SPINDLY family)